MQSGALSSVRDKNELVCTVVGLTAALKRLMAASGADAWMDLQNITVKQLKVMLILSQHGPETVTALAQQLRVHISTVTGILDRLVQQKLVQREEDPDDRRYVFEIPPRKEMGQLACNVAFQLTRLRKNSPRKIAEDIVAGMDRGAFHLVRDVQVAGPGFINFYRDEQAYARLVLDASAPTARP